ncbi:hypothetical protein [Methanobrevibacter sp.]|uniref:hypothetical protein n=1 Tax=Methanobrevibacter sp. TaxID=66852 RepID=UPI0025FBE9AD|nr:hypothetical protein [Methanobrevibacter sp.]MBQ2831259.1 hypothetical protein [Methanobrevibacter sp.]
MGFYSANTPEQKRVKKLTGDINISDMFKNECETRGIPIYNAYNIQKRLLHEVEQEQLHGVKEVDDRLMELLDERSKNKVTHRYVDFISNEDSASRGVIPPRSDEKAAQSQEEKTSLPPKDQIRIPPRARDGQEFYRDDELPEIEMLKKIMLQNKKIINQNKIIIDLLKKQGENND